MGSGHHVPLNPFISIPLRSKSAPYKVMVKSRHCRVQVLGFEAWGSHLLMRSFGQVAALSEPQVPPSAWWLQGGRHGPRSTLHLRSCQFTDEKQTLKELRDLTLPLTATRWQGQDLNPNSKSILLPSESVGLLPSQNQQDTYLFKELAHLTVELASPKAVGQLGNAGRS